MFQRIDDFSSFITIDSENSVFSSVQIVDDTNCGQKEVIAKNFLFPKIKRPSHEKMAVELSGIILENVNLEELDKVAREKSIMDLGRENDSNDGNPINTTYPVVGAKRNSLFSRQVEAVKL